MLLNDLHIQILTAVRDLMSQSLETEIATGEEDDVSYFICTNVSRVIIDGRDLWSEIPAELRTVERELLVAIHSGLGGRLSFSTWLYSDVLSCWHSLDRLGSDADPSQTQLYQWLAKNPLIVQQCRLAWLDRIIETREIK